ncbi:MAG: pyridoxal-5'-phosphate-dependent protein subunit beta [Armatimonadota bacterium]|nr:pyridoxal-5'-phosphate-dependent protein subunit beta [Armatimonadota bacterium]
MRRLGLERDLVDAAVRDRAVGRFREAGIALPTFAQLASPGSIPQYIRAALAAIDPDAAHPLNLYRVHWYNAADRRTQVPLPEHLVLPKALTGVDAPVVIALGDRFPMIRAHKVLAAYACLAPRVITGQFDPTRHRAVWPSTGNYARGGVAISRIMRCRGIAVLPEGMSRERFAWLERWVSDPADIIRTPGTESNVKEIYDRCAELEQEPDVVIFNQFSEFGNHLAHYLCTGRALEQIFEALAARDPSLRLSAFVAASGSAGTLGAGDYLKERHGTLIVAAEALECPTMLYNGFGEHNIQGIGDKHIPLIHNVMNTDLVTAISDRHTDRLDVLFNTDPGREFLVRRKGLPPALVEGLGALGLSSICNVLAAIKVARYYRWGPSDVIVTVATDGAAMYGSERAKSIRKYFPGGFDEVAAAETFGECLAGVTIDHLLELTHAERTRIFNLGYYTWVEQQGVSLADFEARRDQHFWRQMRTIIPVWDAMIEEFNGRTGAARVL